MQNKPNDRCRLKVRAAAMKVPTLIASILLFVSSHAAQSAPEITVSTPDLTPTFGGIPKAPTPRIEIDKPAQAAKPAELKVGRMHAILEQWHGSSYRDGVSVTKIYGAEHWRQFWQEYLQEEQPVDFDENLHQAVYIALGMRPTGGYAVEVVRVYEEDKHLVLEYIEHEPAPERYVTQAHTSPWVMVLLPRTNLRVITREASVTRPE